MILSTVSGDVESDACSPLAPDAYVLTKLSVSPVVVKNICLQTGTLTLPVLMKYLQDAFLRESSLSVVLRETSTTCVRETTKIYFCGQDISQTFLKKVCLSASVMS